MPAADDDWRLADQENWLAGRRLVWRRWSSDDPRWDHDHCTFCWEKFGPFPEAVDAGWVTDDGDEAWLCSTCFADFRDRFRWTIREDEPPS